MGSVNVGQTAGMAGTGAAVGTAITPGIGTAIGATVGAAAGVLTGLLQSGDEEAIRQLQEQALAQYGQISIPAMQQVIAQQIQGTQTDPTYKRAQQAGIQQLMEKARLGGMDPQSRAAYMEAQQRASGDYIGRQKAIESQMASRGALGSGAEWAARSGSASDAAQRLSLASYQAAGDSASRGQQALAMGAQAATAGRGQEDQEAAARDAINEFNARMRFDAVNQNNNNAQRVFGDRLDLAKAKAEALGARAGGYERSEGRTANAVQGGGQLAGELAQLGMYAYNKQNQAPAGDGSYVDKNGVKTWDL